MIEPGQKFFRLCTVKEVRRGHSVYWECSCECGNTAAVERGRLLNGRTKSCGCYRAEANAIRHISHGLRYSRAYKSWAGMRQRCTNPKNPDWPAYGGRGISVCPSWATFEGFFQDMGEPAPGLTIDRIDVNGNYETQNCRWATRQEQRLNQRVPE